MYLLETIGLCKNFGSLAAVHEVDFTSKEGEFHAIIGPNGAGKTTFFNLISGKYRPTSGQILFKGEHIAHLSPHKLVRKGISRSFQITNVFADLSVFESVRLGIQSRAGFKYNFLSPSKARTGQIEEETWQVLEKTNLADRHDVPASNITHSDQRCLEIALTLSTKPILLLLDEPTAGMTPEETNMIVSLIKDISKGLTVLLIEHDMDVVFSVADTITVFHYGKIIAQGNPNDVKNDEEAQKAYLGGLT